MKRVVLHIGAPKTGTSALQIALVRNREALSKRDICYPQGRLDADAMAGRITSGNGMGLAKHLRPTLPFPDEFDPSPMQLDAGIILYSSEHMSFFDEASLKKFREQVEATGRSLEVAYFVRSITEHAISVYQQLVKRSDYTEGFSTFLRGNYTSPFAETLRRLQNVLPAAAIHVLVYDEVKSSLLQSLVAALGVKADGLVETAEIVNRALSKDEIAQVIEKTKAGEKSTRVSDDILYGKPAERPQPSIAEEDFIEVVRKHYRDVNVVNTFLGRCALTLKMPETQVTTG